MSLNVCKKCGKEFKGAGKSDVYCSDECRIAGIDKRNLHPTNCPKCGISTWFLQGQSMCNACRKREYFHRHRESEPSTGRGKYKYVAKERPTQINVALNTMAAKARAAGMNYGEYVAKVRCGLI